MKKVLGFLAIVATVVGMSTMVMAKSFSDVKSSSKYAESIDILSDLKVVSGYSDGTYKPGNSVKRSEMAKLLIVAMGKESYATSLEGNTNFNDVTSSHWASGYINLASSLGLIKGYPDGTFRPDATVSYVEASTMMLRALDYKKELDGLSWPTGYMSKANSAGLLENVTADSSADAAIRGNVANMILNTLKANTRKVVESNSTGNVYGNGDILLEKTFSNLKFVKSGTIIDIDVESSVIKIDDKNADRKIEVVYSKEDIKKVLGRTVSFIYDEKKEEFLTFKFTDKYTIKEVNVDEIDDDIIFDDSDEYELPKSSNIVIVGTSKYEDVKKAYLTIDSKKKVLYAVLEGVEKIYAGIITDKNISVGDKKAIEVRNIEGDYEELILANSKTKVTIGDIALYAYDEDEEIMIRQSEDIEDAKEVEKLTKDSIQLDDEDEIKFSEDDTYFVYLIEDGYINEGKLTDIDEDFDRVTVVNLNGVYYILNFVESINPDDIAVDISVTDAKKELYSAIKIARKKKEANYSVTTFEELRSALKEAETIYDAATSYSPAKIVLATRKLNKAIENLKADTADDIELRDAYSKLQDTIKSAEKLNKDDYTKESYEKLSKAIADAKKIDLKVTTIVKVTDATNKITTMRASLVTNLAAEQVKKVTDRLDAAIANANKIIKNERLYTADSFDKMKKALNEAKSIDRTILGVQQLNQITTNLETAIDALVMKS